MNVKSASAQCPKVDTVNYTQVYVVVKQGTFKRYRALPTYQTNYTNCRLSVKLSATYKIRRIYELQPFLKWDLSTQHAKEVWVEFPEQNVLIHIQLSC